MEPDMSLNHNIEKNPMDKAQNQFMTHGRIMWPLNIFNKRHEGFKKIADQIMNNYILPRMENLVDHFTDAMFVVSDDNYQQKCICTVDDITAYSTSLLLVIEYDEPLNTLLLMSACEISPACIHFNGSDQLHLSLEAPDECRLVEWLDTQLSDFNEFYTKLKAIKKQRSEHSTIDPVCGMTIDKRSAVATVVFEKIPYYFCVQDCRDLFETDPQKYIDNKQAAPHSPLNKAPKDPWQIGGAEMYL